MRFRRLAVTAAALTAVIAGAAPAAAQTGGGANNLVQVVNTTHERFSSRAGVQAASFGGDSAQSTNLARADSRNCTGCTTQAAALQAVFLTGAPSTVEVANAAVATNSACVRCVSYAYAFQYVVTTDRAVSLSPAGRQRISDLQARASAVVSEPAGTLEDLQRLDTELDLLAHELRETVDQELRAGGHAATTRGLRDRQAAAG